MMTRTTRTIACLPVALLAIGLTQTPSARGEAAAVEQRPMTFTVENRNGSRVPCASDDAGPPGYAFVGPATTTRSSGSRAPAGASKPSFAAPPTSSSRSSP